MDKREKVIKDFEKLREYADSEVHPVVSPDNWCVYSWLRDLIDETEEDALALLKAQEPVKPTMHYVPDGKRSSAAWQCGNCLIDIGYGANYCYNCGKAVKWDG